MAGKVGKNAGKNSVTKGRNKCQVASIINSVGNPPDAIKSRKDSTLEYLCHPFWFSLQEISLPYTFFLLNEDMELHRNRHLFI
jgi:hypothetical protein